jgi:ubiquinone/menaquinone biosynthesis C-methylase UbiE
MPTEHRTQKIAATFDDLAPTYESAGVPWFVPIAAALVDELDPHHREHVLDVGTGTGVALPLLAAAVGPHGRVVGIDISPRMLDRAKHSVALRELHNVELYEMDAQNPDLPAASFNAVSASMVVYFLADPTAALRHWHELLLPLGKIGLTTLGSRTPVWDAVDDLFRPFLPPGLPGPFTADASLRTDDGIAALVAGAGFTDIYTKHVELPVVFSGAAQWREWSRTVGHRMWWAAVPQNQREELFYRASDLLERHAQDDGRIHLVQDVRITVGFRSLAG